MRDLNAPCKNCEDRCVEPNCHMTCEYYNNWAKIREANEKKRKKKAETLSILYAHRKNKFYE